MKRRRWLLLSLPVLLSVGLTAFAPTEAPRTVRNESFGRGEVVQYKVHYGLINAAEATIEVSDDIHRVNDRPCYRATVTGRTNGSFDMFLKVRDTWRSYIDTASILPQRFYRNIEENSYRKRETIDFDHYRDMAAVESHKKNKNDVKRGSYKVPDNVQDLVSGFYFLRTVDFSNRRVGEQIKVQGFFDDEVFDMTVTYKGRQNVETKSGVVRAIRLVPRMPKNKLFRGEDAISVYFSDDRNKIPVLFEAEMFVGSVKIDMYKYSGLKHKLAMVAKN
ncbi:DUF3108 domain-containing protein [Solirubrum puertoriconensis]|uniref:ATP-dependent exodnase (Exonuclease V) alpha subunit-helicase superfamily I member n=1 Tax=Solirubrum puertoriconensis TaxID=1751427 RepID=A0A9X0HIK9_SOLP1|nr:DUF3108 domain-containing protein [Solirubrum puertoriconensis]KUG06555.1 ATP-dependent exodnase (exonuclease V) alpha subunit - helicase superfamily I member [Solirubrum puertoriconensis]